ncbi:IS6 family transposase [Halarchaeum acidiphilum]|uniref:IS6 family transposase n=1 Tax=Halarchaeum acidiphilum TaxID=489138 RepID=UPI0009DB7ECA|nr:IS6 family transposase [Halarchaeum acidiphilum]
MAKIARFSGRSDWIELDFVERERTPSELMELGIRLYLSGLSLSNTTSELEKFGVERSRKAVHDWVQKADLQPASDASPDHVALDETVIRINGQQFWLYAAVDPEANEFLHLRSFTTTTTALTQKFLRELRERHDVSDAVFLVDSAQHLATALDREGLRFQTVRHGNRNAVEHLFREIKRRTSLFSNIFSHVDPETAETWLQAFAVWWNSLN